MSQKQPSLERCFAKGKGPNGETEEEPMTAKKKATFNKNYQELYLKHRFIPTGVSDLPIPLCIICTDRVVNKAVMKINKTDL